jgi:ABC-type multidrug transport system ATPase subunit
VIEISGLTRSFGKRQVLGPVSVTVAPGERLALTGPNGSGKSTFLRCVAGTVAPSSGTVTISGHPAGSYEAKQVIGVSLSQERSFYLRLTGTQNLLVFARLRASMREARRRVRAVVEELELADIAARRVDRCSTGMVQQLALARALLADPATILLDEPTRSLDDAAIGRLWGAIEARPQASLIIATHRHEDIELCEHRLNFGAD